MNTPMGNAFEPSGVKDTVTKNRKNVSRQYEEIKMRYYNQIGIQQAYMKTTIGFVLAALGSWSRSLLRKKKNGFQIITRLRNKKS
jgi:hypothetical protein